MTDRDWKGATLFDAVGRAEALTHTDVEEAIAEAVEDLLEGTGAETDAEVAAWLRAEEATVEVVGYRRMSLDCFGVRAAARWAAGRAVDVLHEQGVTGPDDSGHAREERVHDAFEATLVRILREEGGPWGCEEVVRHTYDAEAIIEALRLEEDHRGHEREDVYGYPHPAVCTTCSAGGNLVIWFAKERNNA